MHGFNSMYTLPGVMAHLFVIAQNQQDEGGKEKCGWRLRRKRLGESGAADRPKPPASGVTRSRQPGGDTRAPFAHHHEQFMQKKRTKLLSARKRKEALTGTISSVPSFVAIKVD